MSAKVSEAQRSFGGTQGEVTALRQLLAAAGLENPHTGAPLEERELLVITGGIGAGYSYCPSIPRYGNGGGISIVARHAAACFDGAYQRAAFERLGVRVSEASSRSENKAEAALSEALEAGRPVMVSCGRILDAGREACVPECAGYAVVVYELAGERVVFGDVSAEPRETTRAQLRAARAAVCTHENRSFVIDEAPALSEARLAEAIRSGLRACAEGLLAPRVKTFGLAGFDKWLKALRGRGKGSWSKDFPGGKLAWPLEDVFASIETRETGGGLLRPAFAEGLRWAAEQLEATALEDLAETYRALGASWSTLAERCLPASDPRLGELARLHRRCAELIHGPRSRECEALEAASQARKELVRALLEDEGWMTEADRAELQASVHSEVEALAAREQAAAEALRAALK